MTWKTCAIFSGIELALVGAAYLIGLLAGIDPLGKFRWTWIATRGGLLTPLIPLGIFALFVGIRNHPTLQYLKDLKQWIGSFFEGWNISQYLLLSLCAGVGEEILFRGVFQEGLTHICGNWPALIITGVAFGLMHWKNNTYFILATFMGMFLGALYWQSQNLLAPIICHALYDFVVMIVLTRWIFPRITLSDPSTQP